MRLLGCALMVLLAVPAVAAPIEVAVTPAEAAALRALGPEVGYFTSRRRPLRALGQLTRARDELATPNLELARGLMALLRAAEVAAPGGAIDICTLIGPAHLAGVFAGAGPVKLLVVRETDGREARAIEAAGGARLVFRGEAGARLGERAPVAAAPALAPAPGETSFGRLVGTALAPTARARKFDPIAPAVTTRTARPGHEFVILKIERDFGRGLGHVAYLFGSGIIVEPAWDRLPLEVDGRRVTAGAIHADGLALELGYEIPARARRLVLLDGPVRIPLALPDAGARAAGP